MATFYTCMADGKRKRFCADSKEHALQRLKEKGFTKITGLKIETSEQSAKRIGL